MLLSRTVVGLLTVTLCCWAGAASAQEGIVRLHTGQIERVEWSLDKVGLPVFKVKESAQPLAADRVHVLQHPSALPVATTRLLTQRLLLANEQSLTCELLNLGEKTVQVRTGWGQEITLARAAIHAWEHPQHAQVLFSDNFETDLARWKLIGTPKVGPATPALGKQCLLLLEADQGARFVPTKPLPSVRGSLAFLEQTACAGRECTLELVFRSDDALKEAPSEKVRVSLAGQDRVYTLTSTGKITRYHPFARFSAGWHRLDFVATPTTWSLSIAGCFLGEGELSHKNMTLREVSVHLAQTDPKVSKGGCAFTNFVWGRHRSELTPKPTDPQQDEVRLSNGDQYFGKVTSLTRQQVCLTQRQDPLRWEWGDVARVSAAPGSVTTLPADTRPEVVQLRVATGMGLHNDLLAGVCKAVSAERVVLQHPHLGELTIPLAWAYQVRWPHLSKK